MLRWLLTLLPEIELQDGSKRARPLHDDDEMADASGIIVYGDASSLNEERKYPDQPLKALTGLSVTPSAPGRARHCGHRGTMDQYACCQTHHARSHARQSHGEELRPRPSGHELRIGQLLLLQSSIISQQPVSIEGSWRHQDQQASSQACQTASASFELGQTLPCRLESHPDQGLQLEVYSVSRHSGPENRGSVVARAARRGQTRVTRA